MSRNADVQAPIARASDRIAAAEVTLFFLSCRQPKMASARSESSHAMSRMSRLSSRCRSAEPNALRASAGSRPCSMASCDVRLELFVDLAAQTIAAKYICNA